MNENQKKLLGDLPQVAGRLNLLDTVISFLFQEVQVVVNGEKVMRKRDILTDGEKICVNQERACLREYRDHLLGGMDLADVRYYQVSMQIENKIETALQLIIDLDWKRNTNDIIVN